MRMTSDRKDGQTSTRDGDMFLLVVDLDIALAVS